MRAPGQGAAPAETSSFAMGFLFLTITSVGWGLNWPVMKHLLTELPPLSARGWSGLGGAVALALVVLARRENMAVPRELRLRLVLIALLTISTWPGFIGLSLLWLRASEAAVIAASMPVWVSLLALVILHEHFSMPRALALAVAMTGLAILFGADGFEASVGKLPGALFAIAATLCVALGTVLTKRFPFRLPAISLATWQIAIGCVPVILAGLLLERPDFAALSAKGWLLMAYMTFVQSRVTNAPMETRGGVATWDDADGTLTYHVATQTPHALRLLLAELMDQPLHRVRVTSGDIGGSFGQKSGVRAEDLALCAVARRQRRRVAWTEDRRENLEVAGQGRDERITVEAAVDDAGILVGLRAWMDLDHGAHPVVPSAVGAAVHGMVRVLLPGPYQVRGYEFHARVACTNKAPYNAYRGPWQVETWVRERLMDVAARAVGDDPIAFRRRNFAHAHATTVTGADLAGTTLVDTFEAVVDRVDLTGFWAEQAAARRRGRHLGIGVAAMLEPAPGPPAFRDAIGFPLRAERVRARLEPDGGVVVFTGQSPHGQSHRTTLAQVAASSLGIPRARVQVVVGDTRVTPVSLAGTGGSRSAAMAGGAIVDAMARLDGVLHDLAAAWSGCPRVEVAREGDGYTGPAGRVSIASLARAAHLGDPRLPVEVASWLEVDGTCDGSRGSWAQATHCCWVEVDLGTGRVHVRRYLVVADCGVVVNPAVVEGQVRGGVAQGLGSVLFERVVHGPDGAPRTSGLDDYLLPLAGDVPEIEVFHLDGSVSGPADFRGVGEGGAIAAPAALTNAIEDALSPFGVRVSEQHLPPGRILELAGLIQEEH